MRKIFTQHTLYLLFACSGIILSLTGREAIVTIKDDDFVTVKFSGDVYNVSEGDGVLVVRVESSVPADNDLSLGISVSEGTAKCEATSNHTPIICTVHTK